MPFYIFILISLKIWTYFKYLFIFKNIIVKNGGSGLGLTITRQIIEYHKGKIYVESKIGEGSKFTIILPDNF